MQSQGVFHVRALDLRVEDRPWPYAQQMASPIERHWDDQLKTHPEFFNGTVHMTAACELLDTRLEARLIPVEFKAFLYWRDQGFPEAGVVDGFGSALVTADDGGVLLGRQRPGQINSGLAYLPGGFIDSRDVAADGTVDIAASTARELAEETGLSAAELTVGEGAFVARAGQQMSFAVPYAFHGSSGALVEKVTKHLAAEDAPELLEVMTVRAARDLDGLAMPPYADTLLRWLFTPGNERA